jgi:DNA-binding response OmpR family regulator
MRQILQRFSTAPIRVLIVEPQPDMAQKLMQCLREVCRVELVTTGQQAYQRFVASSPQVVLTEFSLPDMTGIELLRAGIAGAQTRQTAWVLMTDRRSVADKVSGFQAGAADYLVKPLRLETLGTHLVNLYRQHQLLHRLHIS